jgi:hypothetical protein
MPLIVGTFADADEEFPPDLPTQLYLGDSGIVLGNKVTDAHGCRWTVSGADLWGSKPTPREQTSDRNYEHGLADHTRFYGARNIPLTGSVHAPDHATLHATKQRFYDIVGVEPFIVRGTEPGFDSFTVARQTGELLWTEVTPTFATFTAALLAPDPRLYSMLERSFALAFPTTSGGRSWPASWPDGWDVDVVAGSQVLSNPGNLAVPLRLRVRGPAESVQLTFAETGKTLRLANPDSPVLLNNGEWLDIDTRTHQVLLMGDSPRRSWATGTWLQLPSHTDTTLTIQGTGTTSDSGVSGNYRAARI